VVGVIYICTKVSKSSFSLVEWPSKHEALSSNPNTTKKKGKKSSFSLTFLIIFVLVFLMIAILNEFQGRYNFKEVLICIFLISKDFEHFFMY
jgi:cytoskeletal protein RodZ